MSTPEERKAVFDGAFGRIIAEIDEPQTDQARHLSVQLDQGCADACAAALRTGKKATVTLKLTFDASGQGRVEITPKLDTKLPAEPLNGAVMYSNLNGDISSVPLDNPARQMEFTPGGVTPIKRGN